MCVPFCFFKNAEPTVIHRTGPLLRLMVRSYSILDIQACVHGNEIADKLAVMADVAGELSLGPPTVLGLDKELL